jgi:hypothetical protein
MESQQSILRYATVVFKQQCLDKSNHYKKKDLNKLE